VRVVVSSTPGAGHVFPMVPVVLALRRAGHEIVWATGRGAGAWLDRLGIDHVEAGLDAADRTAAAAAAAPGLSSLPPTQRRVVIGPTNFGRIAAPAMLPRLEALVDQVQPQVVLTEPCELAAPLVAAAGGLPVVTVGFGDLLPKEVCHAMAEAVAPLWGERGLAVPPDAGIHGDLYLHPFPTSLTEPDDRTVTPVRPEGFDGSADDPPTWVADLGRDRPFVYVTFGTEFGPMAPFGPLFVALGRLDADVVVTVGRRVEPAALPAAPSNVRVEAFVPQRALLERASLVVSHGGSGTVLGAAAAGTPQLCLPLGADQFDNAAAVAAGGIGASLMPDQVTPEALGTAMVELLDHPPAAAARVAAEIAAMPSPREVAETITALAGC